MIESVVGAPGASARVSRLSDARRAGALAILMLGSAVCVADGLQTGSTLTVTEGGAASISIPIQVPRGIGGLEPQLSLSYSSQAGGGLLGMGWTLTGPSIISRCPRNQLHDGQIGKVNFDANDRYCLDGVRLLADGGTGYHPASGASRSYVLERDSFARITATGDANTAISGAPVSFAVETKSGLRMAFGGADGKASALTKMVSGTGNTVSRWYLRTISDRMATPNSVEFFYCGGVVSVDGGTCNEATYTGSKVLWYIRYTNRGATMGTQAVVFGYEPRPDRRLVFASGSSSVQGQRMATISTYVGFTSTLSPGTRVKIYEFTYEPVEQSAAPSTRATNVSRLTRVQELRGNTTVPLTRPPNAAWSVADALPPIDFVYPPDTIHGMGVPQVAAGTGGSTTDNTRCGGYLAKAKTTDLCP